MRRDHFDLDVRNLDWVTDGGEPQQPVALISFSGPTDELVRRLRGPDDRPLAGDDIDVGFRLRDPFEESDEPTGVVSVANRLTGDFLFETNESAEDVFAFITAAREYGQVTNTAESRYRIELSYDDETVTYEKATFLVYDNEGDLLRSQSLIPSGVEL